LRYEDGICTRAVVSLGALGPVPCRAYSIEQKLEGKPIRTGIEQLRGVFPEEAKPRISQFKRYKEQAASHIACSHIRACSTERRSVMARPVQFFLNDRLETVEVDENEILIDTIRERFRLCGTKEGLSDG